MLADRLEIICKNLLVERDMPAPSSGRQTLLFSATMPPKIRELIPAFVREHRVTNLMVGHYGDRHGGSCESIRQIIKQVNDDEHRIQCLLQDLRQVWDKKKGRVVIFSNMRITADKLAHKLQN